jgi:hypothetical protein
MQLTFAKSSLAIAVWICLIASPAAAQEPADEFERWVPSLWLGMGFLAQRGYGDVQSSVRPAAEDDDIMLVPLVGLGAELMTPSLIEPGGHPRIFISGGVRYAPKVERSLAQEGNPGSMLLPDPVPEGFDAQLIANQGSDVSVYTEPWVWRAGLGVAFTVPVRERRLQIKPSVEYFQEQVKIEGIVTNATDKPEPVPPTRRPDEVFELTELGASTTETFRGLGPRLALELEAAQSGSVGVSVFVEVATYWLLGDRDVSFGATDGTQSAVFGFKKSSVAFDAGLGVRFSWRPTGE